MQMLDLERAMQIADSGYAFAQKTKNPVLIGAGLEKMAHARQMTGRGGIIKLYRKALANYQKAENKNGEARCYKSIGSYYERTAKPDSAIYYLEKSLEILLDIGEDKPLISIYTSLGNAKRIYGDYVSALEYFKEALSRAIKLDYKIAIAYTYSNIANCYQLLSRYDQSLENYNESLEILKGLNDRRGVAMVLYSLANVFEMKQDTAKSVEYFKSALTEFEAINDLIGISGSLYSLGRMEAAQKRYVNARKYIERSLSISRQLNEVSSISECLNVLGTIYQEAGEYRKAVDINLEALKLAREAEAKDVMLDILPRLAILYEKLNEHDQANIYLYQLMDLKDSLINKESIGQINELAVQYETEKKDYKMKLKEAELKKEQAEVKRQNLQKIFFAAAFGLMVLLAFVIFRSYHQKRKDNVLIASQKEEVEHQKEIVEEKNREILDSIAYAKRIQSAILPPMKLVKEYLTDSFIIYKPKDIVAGDFYWMEVIRDITIFASADCTGHGVPGAMVSVVCHNAMNRSVREFGLTNPASILDKTRELVIETFIKSDQEVKDGMDISLCALNTKTNQLQWAGANNPLWLIRNGTLTEYKADKQPIGKFAESNPFTSHSIQLEHGDTIYIFTDGFTDQFGGEKGKKFKSKPFKELLVSLYEQPMDSQSKTIMQTFEHWKGNLEQVDDVCIIGVRV